MFDSETVAFVSGECDASSMKVEFFHRSSPAPAASCAEIVLFPQFQACCDRFDAFTSVCHPKKHHERFVYFFAFVSAKTFVTIKVFATFICGQVEYRI